MKKSSLLISLFIFVLAIYAVLLTVFGNKEWEGSYAIIFNALHTVNIIATIFIMLTILSKNDNSQRKVIWLAIMILIPIYGIFIYLIVARDYKTKFIQLDRPKIKDKTFLLHEPGVDIDLPAHDIFGYAHRLSGRTPYEGDTKTKVLTNGDMFFPELLKRLSEAKDSIYMAFYIIKRDLISREIMEILKEKAQKGVKVYLIYDLVGSKWFRGKLVNELKSAGAHVVPFERLTPLHFFNAINFRYHRKLTIVDGKVGFIGGLNIGNEYNHKSRRFGFWRDTHLLVEGRGVISLTNIFIKDWYFATGKWLDTTYHYEKVKERGKVVVLESGPDYEEPIIKQVYFKMITDAKKSIKITTPYLMLEPEMLYALQTAAESGISVTILVPGKPDKFWVNQATKSYYEVLLQKGVEIYEYTNVFVHSKVLIIDDKIASVGSVNFDPRSFNINFEATVLIENASVKDLVHDFAQDLSKSTRIELTEWRKRSLINKIFQGFANLFTPLL